MDRAASSRQLDVVQFLHEHRSDGCTTRAMNAAAFKGYLAAQFLHDNRTKGCTVAVMDGAAAGGQSNIVRFLHENRSEGCSTSAMDTAASNNHQFLHENRVEGCAVASMNQAAAKGLLPMVHYLHAHGSEGCTAEAMTQAAAQGFLGMVRFLHEQGCTQDALSWQRVRVINGSFCFRHYSFHQQDRERSPTKPPMSSHAAHEVLCNACLVSSITQFQRGIPSDIVELVQLQKRTNRIHYRVPELVAAMAARAGCGAFMRWRETTVRYTSQTAARAALRGSGLSRSNTDDWTRFAGSVPYLTSYQSR